MANAAGIPTIYNGIKFRSRLEARWAVMFDWFGWRYQYEPLDFPGYIPDYLITNRERPCLVEVKPVTDHDGYWGALFDTVDRLDGNWQGDLMVLGAEPYMCHESLGPYMNLEQRRIATAVWPMCARGMPNNHAHVLRPSYRTSCSLSGNYLPPAALDGWWREAGNVVQWHPKDR